MYKEKEPKAKIPMTVSGKKAVEEELAVARRAYLELLKGRTDIPVCNTTTTSLGQANDERIILSRISELLDTLSRVVIIAEPTVAETSQEIVNIGDTLKVALNANGISMEKRFTLVDYLKQTDGMDKVSVSSPLGAAVYRKQLGSVQSYQAPNGTVEVEILAKLSLEEEQSHGRI